MAEVAFTAPILQGKLDAWRSAMERCQSDNPDYVASRKRLGITREAAWLQQTPAGDSAVVYLEADDLDVATKGLGASAEPFDEWFREVILDVHGIDLAAPAPRPDQVVDHRG